MRTIRFALGILLALAVGLFLPAFALAQDAGAVINAGAPPAAASGLPHFVTEVWFWICLLTPTVVTGLTRYKQLGRLSMLLDLLSLVKHKDSPGTFSVPGMLSKPPAEAQS